MKQPTIAEQLIAGLLALGYKEIPDRSRFRTFKHENPAQKHLLFVGSRGALRAGSNASTSSSLEHTGRYQAILSCGARTLITHELEQLSPEQLAQAAKDANIDYEDQSKAKLP